MEDNEDDDDDDEDVDDSDDDDDDSLFGFGFEFGFARFLKSENGLIKHFFDPTSLGLMVPS